jgi:hypothetical protein
MCGLFGAMTYGELVGLEIDNLKTLGMISSLRGRDSTGLLFGNGGKFTGIKQGIMKDVLPAPEMLWSYEVDKSIKDFKPYLIAGHCRDATIGEVNQANAHPFRHKHIRGMHNGTVTALAPPKELAHEYTDSRVIIEGIADKGLEATLDLCKDGAYALVWTDSNNGTLNFIRNNKRTLFYVKSKGNCLYWASERAMLRFMIDRCYGQFDDIVFCEDDVLYTFKLGVSPVDPVKTSMKKPVVVTPSKYDDLEEVYDPILGRTTYRKKTTKFKPINDNVVKFVKDNVGEIFKDIEDKDAPKTYAGYRGEEYTMREAHRMLGNGCSGCGAVCDEFDKAHWFNHDQYLCGDCTKDDFYGEYGPQEYVEGRKLQ